MNAALSIPLTMSTPGPTPERREAARKIASTTLVVSLAGVVVMTCVVVILLQRIRRRLTDGARPRRTRYSDAWAEAGRRAGSPPAEAFEPGSSEAGGGEGPVADGGGGSRG